MGYTTEFQGAFKPSRPFTESEKQYVNTFSSTRRMKRNVDMLIKLFGGQHGLNGEYGVDGEFFCLDDGDFGQTRDRSVVDFNYPPTTQPGLWCQWSIDEKGNLSWNGAEKFYAYIEWLQYMIDNFFEPWGIKLNGKMMWQGEEIGDVGKIQVKNNIVKSRTLR